MAVTQNILSLDAYYRSTPGDKILVNDLSYFSKADDDLIENALKTIYSNTDVLSTKPCCDCGKLTGRYLLGKLCKTCGTTCREVFDKVYPVLWLRALDPNYKFLNPTFWLMVSSAICKIDIIDGLRWLCDSRYNPNAIDLPPILESIRDNVLDGKRNYFYTMSKLYSILDYLSVVPINKTKKKSKRFEELMKLYKVYEDVLFSEYLPVINKKLFVEEHTSKGRYVNIISADIIDIVKSWEKACSQDSITENLLSSVTGSTVSKFAILNNNYYKKFVMSKQGIFRKNVYGAKSHFTFRCVVVSIPGPHRFDEIIAPWLVGLTAFRPHVLNKLMKRGYIYKEASKKIFKAVNKYDPEIDEILQELIKESPGGRGPAITINRNICVA